MDKKDKEKMQEKIVRFDSLERNIQTKETSLKYFKEMSLDYMTFNFYTVTSSNKIYATVPVNLRELLKSSVIAIAEEELEKLKKEIKEL